MAQGAPTIIRIESAANLEALILQRSRSTNIRAEFLLTDIPSEQVMRWETGVNQILQDCGCVLAAKCTTYTTMFVAGIALVYVFEGKFQWPAFVLLASLSSIAATLAGKSAARAIGRARLRRIAAELRDFDILKSP